MPRPAPDLAAGAVAAAVGDRKSERGQFFTMVSPFDNPAFAAWLAHVPAGARLLEPFAGANNIVRMMDAHRPGARWACFDIEPQSADVAARDTLVDFPRLPGPVAVVTNPPYMAKNVARRAGLHDVADLCGAHGNLYKLAIQRCLDGAEWVAAIIPESFLTSGAFRDRLMSVTSLDRPMFVDTEVPVCLALWGPHPTGDFEVFKGAERLGTWAELSAHLPDRTSPRIVFNDVDGLLGLNAVDTLAGATIRFCPAEQIPAAAVKVSSRHRTRIHVQDLDPADLPPLIAGTNERLDALRAATRDVVLTSFMGLRKDGHYRRRLDFATARGLLAEVLADLDATRPVEAA